MNVQYFKASKYGNKSCRCHAGHIHDSVFEAEYCDSLALLVKAREIVSYQTQVSFDLSVNGKKICSHIVDFVVFPTEDDDKLEVHETKGFATAVWQLKYKLFQAIYPHIPYHIITKDCRYDRRKTLRQR
jgi:hypothetical protein